MKIPVLVRLMMIWIPLMILFSLISVFAAGISITSSNVGQTSVLITADAIKPPACDELYLTTIVSGSGTLTGTAANDLIIGGSGPDMIDGMGGNDCILGSGGDDSLVGNDGIDVCLGGAGNDTFTDCEVESQ